MKVMIVGGALAAVAVAASGCASTSQLSPTAETDITEGYQVLCGPDAPATVSGVVGIAVVGASALPASSQSIISTAEKICVAGVPTSEIVAGVDLFTILVEVEGLTSTKLSAKQKAHIHVLAAKHGKA